MRDTATREERRAEVKSYRREEHQNDNTPVLLDNLVCLLLSLCGREIRKI